MDTTLTQPVQSNPTTTDSSETINETDHRGSLSEGLDQQRSIVKQKEAELKEMQDQIESYNQMVKQLASQREMAVKKLADMDNQIEELNRILETERLQVEAKDKELKTRRTLLQTLKNEENELKEKFNNYKQELESTTENLSSSQLQEKQIESKLTELQQFLAMTNAAIDDIEKAINIKDTIKLSALCSQMITPPAPLTTNALLTNGNMKQTNTTNSPISGQPFGDLQVGQQSNFPTNDNNNDSLFDSSANFDPFAGDDPFDGDDPFKAEDANLALPEDDPFNPSSSASTTGFTLAQNDPFAPPLPPHSRGGF